MKKEHIIRLLLGQLVIAIIAGVVFFWQFQQKGTALSETERQVAELEKKVSQLEAEHSVIHAQVDKQGEAYEEMQSAEQHLAELENSVQAKERELIEARKKIDDLRESVSDLNDRLQPSEQAMTDLEKKIEEARSELRACQERSGRDQVVIENFEKHASDLRQRQPPATAAAEAQMESAYKTLGSELREQLGNKEVILKEDKQRLSLSVSSQILFRFGTVSIAPRGKEILGRVAGALRNIKDVRIRVVGHTDKAAVSPQFRSRYPTNWDLSAARAVAVVRYFQEASGLSPASLEAAGLSSYDPVELNDAPMGRAENSRVEILIIPRLDRQSPGTS